MADQSDDQNPVDEIERAKREENRRTREYYENRLKKQGLLLELEGPEVSARCCCC